jgi:hypothetical protein
MIMIHQPVHPYVSREGWVDYHAAIANAVPDLGVVLYLRTERITGADIAALADRAPNVIGVKYGVRDAGVFAAVARAPTTSAWSRRPWPSWACAGPTSARPAARCRRTSQTRSRASWPAGA